MSYNYSLRGFLVARPEANVSPDQWYINQAVTDLFKELMTNSEKANSWEFQRDATEVCLKTFQATPNFLMTQLIAQRPMNKRCIDFIAATLGYIQTGKRDMYVLGWNDMLQHHPEPDIMASHVLVENAKERFKEIIYKPIDELIPLWLEHRNGFVDMVTSTALFFGGDFGDKRT